MILSRRQTHFYTVVALACTLPVVFFAGLILRPSVPVVDTSVDRLFAIANFPDAGTAFENPTVLSTENVQIRSAVHVAQNSILIDLQPVNVLQYADVLVYWQANTSGSVELQAVDDSAHLLGQLSGTRRRRFHLPGTLRGQDGSLLFYSRGRQALVATFPLTLAA
ncbi:MAG: hypothetical protein AAGB01_09135 [Cyanobacteria bacterium P01_F01_bin.42]